MNKDGAAPAHVDSLPSNARITSTTKIVVIVLATVLTIVVVCGGVLTALLLPAIHSARTAAQNAQDKALLRQVGLAVFQHWDSSPNGNGPESWDDLQNPEWQMGEAVSEIRTLKASLVPGVNRNDVERAPFSPDSRRIATIDDGLTLSVFDLRTGEEVFSRRGHRLDDQFSFHHAVLCFDPTGERVVTCSYDVKFWDAQTGEELLTIPKISGDIIGFDESGETLFVGQSAKIRKIRAPRTSRVAWGGMNTTDSR